MITSHGFPEHCAANIISSGMRKKRSTTKPVPRRFLKAKEVAEVHETRIPIAGGASTRESSGLAGRKGRGARRNPRARNCFPKAKMRLMVRKSRRAWPKFTPFLATRRGGRDPGWIISRQGQVTVPILKLGPVWDPIRKDPRFQALIDKYSAKA